MSSTAALAHRRSADRGGGVPGSGVGESENKRRERVAGLFAVLKRARDRGLGLYGELATAASRWRPRGGSGRMAREGKGQREAKERWRRLWGDAWAPARRKKAAGKPLHDAGVGAVGGRRRGTEQRGGDGNKGSFAISKNSRDPTVKQQ